MIGQLLQHFVLKSEWLAFINKIIGGTVIGEHCNFTLFLDSFEILYCNDQIIIIAGMEGAGCDCNKNNEK